MISNLELAWAAGFFDGEGNIRWNNTTRKIKKRHQREYGTIVVQIGQIDRDVLDRFCYAVGCGKVYGPYGKKNRAHPYFYFAANGHNVEKVFGLIWPYLSLIKRQQGETALARWQEQKNRPKSKYDKYARENVSCPIAYS